MNLSGLKYFLEVARCNSIRRASERLHIAASAISRQISALEHELDCVLLERRSDGVSLTDAGKTLLVHWRKIDMEIQLVQSDIDDLKKLHRGTVRLATVEGVTENFLPQVMAEFSKLYPDVAFVVSVQSRDDIVSALDLYEADIGFVYDHIHHPSIEILSNYRQPLHGFVPPSNALARGAQVSLGELLAHDHVMPDPSFGISQLIKRVAEKQKASVTPQIVSNKLHLLCKCAVLYDAVVFVPVQAVWDEVESGVLAPVNLDCPEFEHRDLSISVRRGRTLPHAAVLFAEFAAAQFETWQSKDSQVLERSRAKWWQGEV